MDRAIVGLLVFSLESSGGETSSVPIEGEKLFSTFLTIGCIMGGALGDAPVLLALRELSV